MDASRADEIDQREPTDQRRTQVKAPVLAPRGSDLALGQEAINVSSVSATAPAREVEADAHDVVGEADAVSEMTLSQRRRGERLPVLPRSMYEVLELWRSSHRRMAP